LYWKVRCRTDCSTLEEGGGGEGGVDVGGGEEGGGEGGGGEGGVVVEDG